MAVRMITPTVNDMVFRMNQEIRIMNLMMDQLYDQHEKIDELRAKKARYPKSRRRRADASLQYYNAYKELEQELTRLETEAKKIKFYDIKSRLEMRKNLATTREKLEKAKERLLNSNHMLNVMDDRMGRVESDIEEVLMPNYIQHLSKFYSAYRRYLKIAKSFENLTGQELPPIDTKKIVCFRTFFLLRTKIKQIFIKE